MEQERIILPLAKSPITYSGMRIAPLEITFLNNNAYNWFASAFIQVKCEKLNHRALIINHDHNPYIKKHHVIVNFLNRENIIEFVKNNIKNNQYLQMRLNQFFINERTPYQKYNFSHMEFVFGFDDSTSELYIKNYNNKQQWKETTIKYNDFIEAYFNQKKKNIFIYRLKNNVNQGFNYKIFKKGLLCYYNSSLPLSYQIMIRAISIEPRPFECYGMKTHYHLRQILLRSVNNTNESPSIKVHAFWEHKKCMVMRLEYVKDKNYVDDIDDIIEAYKYIEQKYLLFRNLTLKFEYNRQERVINKIVKEMEELEIYELNILRKLLIKLNCISEKSVSDKPLNNIQY